MNTLLAIMLMLAIPVAPLQQEYTDKSQHTIAIQAPNHAWGVRSIARLIDREVDGLVIKSHRGLKCRNWPNVTCIRMIKRDFGKTIDCGSFVDYYGCAKVGGIDPWMKINTHWYSVYGKDRNTVCHEFLHTLGIMHHDMPGCMYNYTMMNPSNYELQALRKAYQ